MQEQQEKTLESLECTVQSVIFRSPDNGYAVLLCSAEEQQEPVITVGEAPGVYIGCRFLARGSWVEHPKYGHQFKVDQFRECIPVNVRGIRAYLASRHVKGIGREIADRIVDMFGERTFDIIENHPKELLRVRGIGPGRAARITEGWKEEQEVRDIMTFLQGCGVSTSIAERIYMTYGKSSIESIRKDPYRLAEEAWGIGFKTADAIAMGLGFGREEYARLKGGTLFTLRQEASKGNCYVPRKRLARKASELLDVDTSLVLSALSDMEKSGVIETEYARLSSGKDVDAVYLPHLRHAEKNIVERLYKISIGPFSMPFRVDGPVSEPDVGFIYDDIQAAAIQGAAEHKVLILTGGPGTGKTTTTLGIINVFRRAGARILLAAPTGRAAKRMSEVTGMQAVTIHRLLGMKPGEGFQLDESNPLSGDVLIVDECSMVDVLLMDSLLRAVPDSMSLVFVGDADQLPSVGPGNVLHDLIACGCFPVVRLDRVFRQAQASRIITNAHKINKGEMPDISNGKDTDFYFIDIRRKAIRAGRKGEEAEMASEEIVRLVGSKLPDYYDVSPCDIQVLSPMHKGPAGTDILNTSLQEAVNPPGPADDMLSIKRREMIFRVGDRVMQVRNNYDKGVFNGEIGFIKDVNVEDATLTVCFDNRAIVYESGEFDELKLAYASTIHKSQGSEYPIIVMPVLMDHGFMLQRNLLYTGVTRAQRVLVLIGTKDALWCAVQNANACRRNTLLAERAAERFRRAA